MASAAAVMRRITAIFNPEKTRDLFMIMINSEVSQEGSGDNLRNSFSESTIKTRGKAARDRNGESS
jgi:hypothetical protein